MTVAQVVWEILTRSPLECTRNLVIADEVLDFAGVIDVSVYGGPAVELELGLFLDG